MYASADEFREPCFSNKRRLGPQITVEDNKAESAAAPAVVRHSQQRIDVNGVAVGANSGVFSQDNTDGQI